MWIRSQDREELVNADAIYLRLYQEGYGIGTAECLLGMYSTEEKALKVMDMIEDAIIEHEISNHKCKIILYMPKGDEVDV